MQTLEQTLSSYDNATKRSALYYLTRYLKQAAIFDDYEKDIFVEAEDSVPSETVKNLTLELIVIVEKTAGKEAKDFSDEEFENWMDVIAEIEDKIDIEPQDKQIQKAISELNQFSMPDSKDKNGS